MFQSGDFHRSIRIEGHPPAGLAADLLLCGAAKLHILAERAIFHLAIRPEGNAIFGGAGDRLPARRRKIARGRQQAGFYFLAVSHFHAVIQTGHILSAAGRQHFFRRGHRQARCQLYRHRHHRHPGCASFHLVHLTHLLVHCPILYYTRGRMSTPSSFSAASASSFAAFSSGSDWTPFSLRSMTRLLRAASSMTLLAS